MDEIEIKDDKSLIKKNKIDGKKSKYKNIIKKKFNLKKSKKIFKSTSKSKQSNIKIKLVFYFIFIIIIYLIIFLFYKSLHSKREESESNSEFNKIIFNSTIEKDREEEYRDIQNYMDLVFNGTVIDKDKTYPLSKNPKISIVISCYNGEGYLKTVLLSVQNQDFKDIEIIIVDDYSKDNSVNTIKELMKTEPRIVLIQNEENKGALYTKSRGMLNAKGKYVMILDVDDIFCQRDAFSTLYVEAEKYNLDDVGFFAKRFGKKVEKDNETYGDKKRIITEPELKNLMFHPDSEGNIKQFGGFITTNFMRTSVIKKAIKKIDEKNMNTHMVYFDDFALFFLFSRTVKRIKYIDRIFYILYEGWPKDDEKIRKRNQIKRDNVKLKSCFSRLNFLEIIFKNTDNTFEDKKIAFSQLEFWYLNSYCKEFKETREKAFETFKIFLGSEFIKEEDKNKIKLFMNTFDKNK